MLFRSGYDIIAQGMSGIMLMTGMQGSRPVKVGIAMNDIAAGITTTYAVLGALVGRLRHGEGQYVETSLLEAGLAWTHWEFAAFFGAGERPTANGTRHRRSAPYQALRTQDGYVTVGANTDKLWKAFCQGVCDQPGWIDVLPGAEGGEALKSVAHGHGPDCSTIRKIVRFQLPPGSYRAVVSGLLQAKAKLMLVAD